jgi:hypothetical protein
MPKKSKHVPPKAGGGLGAAPDGRDPGPGHWQDLDTGTSSEQSESNGFRFVAGGGHAVDSSAATQSQPSEPDVPTLLKEMKKQRKKLERVSVTSALIFRIDLHQSHPHADF